MTYSAKEKTLSLFFLLLAFLVGSKLLGSEFSFLVRLVIGFISICLIILILYFVAVVISKQKKFAGKMLIFIFFSLSLSLLHYSFASQLVNSILEEMVTKGLLLFIMYVAFFVVFNLNVTINSLVSLVSLCLIPAFALSDMIYSAETFAVFGFLTLILSAMLMTLQLRQNYETN
ncbi:hypothetical protein A2866_03990 [Candidatus Roizmanbacteria bacterium RIFCSPHIGHO2_01_FULL_39_8]|uniref:Uncharacterized protein n=3 Tax=Candidatus Roizmaniibacteriota TaxID=1752723 RepID=A0A1F7GP55_9BACT|nr:MAG: hypothetical protein A2866_03990 [Candidatus Roizmanbacteria bacterium RIFCSPHIGHO2_01_FULL_39_8]OGK26616.1 MAG: hypothetical protein A3C28_03870 [Candidatus Roizmanbacteria bacterium RIFCSPHIGHO2_02_FULL_39_9]OGK35179.1 MAG: hypothetical protein A3F60_02825 [Candidatus Roizmanbacteria bacterium RIFCSPHIGHO2_12_FULL_39_8]